MNISIPTLIDELKSDDIKKRINSIKHLTIIASALGPERTRAELIPFISNEILDDEDEVLLLIAEVLGNFVEHVGGQGYCRILLPLLETLCQISDEQVREKTIASLKKMILKNEDYFVSMLKRFNVSEYYTCKIVACDLIPNIYGSISAITQSEILNIYKNLMKDSLPMVRKAAAKSLSALIKVLNPGQDKDIMEIFQGALKDEEDFVRLFLVEALIQLANFLPMNKYKEILAGFFQSLSNDLSWRIRYILCDKIKELGLVLGKDSCKNLILPLYVKSLQESEPELRSIAASNLQSISHLISQKMIDVDDVISKVCPIMKTMQSDSLTYVRSALAEQILTLCGVFGKKNTNEIILPIFLLLLKDDEIEVRVNLFKKINEIVKVLGVNTLSQSLIPGLIDLASDNNWRIRVTAIEYLSFFAKQIGEDFFSDKVMKMIGSLITDKIFAVREAMIKSIYELTEIFGEKWLEKNILEKYLKLAGSTNYLFRETFLFFMQKISVLLSQELITHSIIQILFDLSRDPIANVKMNSAKSLKSCFGIVSEKDKDAIKIVLIKLSNDDDWDVKVVTRQCLESLSIVC